MITITIVLGVAVVILGWVALVADRAAEQHYARYAESERKRYEMIRRFRSLNRDKLHAELDQLLVGLEDQIVSGSFGSASKQDLQES